MDLPGPLDLWPHHPLPMSPQVICAVGDSCAGPPALHVSQAAGLWEGTPTEASRPDSRSAVIVEITGTSKSPLPKPNVGFIRDRWVSMWGRPLGGEARPMLILRGL